MREIKMTETIENLPALVWGWCSYKGGVYFAHPNIEKTERCHRPIIDLHYCATKFLNGIVLKSVNYDPELFEENELTLHQNY